MLQIAMAKLWRRQDDVLSLEEFVFHPVVGELFELLEGQQRSRTHSFMIRRRKKRPGCGHPLVDCSGVTAKEYPPAFDVPLPASSISKFRHGRSEM